MSERVERCLEDVRADLQRQGGLSSDDVHRLIAAHELTPDETAVMFKALSSLGVDLTEPDVAADDQEDGPALPAAVGQMLHRLKDVRLLTADQEVALGRRIEAGLAAEVEAQNAPERACELVHLVQDGRVAKEALILANVRLVVSIAKRHQEQGLDFADLVQEGMFGLIRATEKFDYRLGYKFSTYATWWIRQSLTRGLANQSRLIRLPVHFVEFLNSVKRAARAMEHELGRAPRLRELAQRLDTDPAKVQMALDYSRAPLSMDAPVGSTEMTAEMFMPSVHSVEHDVLAELQRQEVAAALASLKEFLRAKRGVMSNGAEILARRYGFEDGRVWTLDEIGREYGVTRERIRQVQEKVLASNQVRELFRGLRPQ
jgi:RNA polymerase primary sigma factor